MTKQDIRRYSLDETREMIARGESQTRDAAPEGPDLSDDFWREAVIVRPKAAESVHLRLDPEVHAYFKAITGGKGHITLMQNVLRAFVEAHKKGKVPPGAP